ncbi:MAG: tetratricopeptide repeat protein [Spirosomaceae bacterium]|nr:tetratricopeptide repeat protein [Spirosomataceae bacterium]
MSKKTKKNLAENAVKANATPSLTDTILIQPSQINYLFCAIVAFIGIIIYANTYNHGFVLDDTAAITRNLFVQKGLAGIPEILKSDFWYFSNAKLGYYRPLGLITFAIEYQLFGLNSTVSHINNIILYAISGFLLTILLQKWFSGRNKFFSFFVGLIFITHPIHTEVVANIKSRDEILGFLFTISAILLHWKYLETSKIKFLISGLITMYLALLSKETSFVGIGVLAISLYFVAKKSLSQSIFGILPYVVVVIIFFIQKNALIGKSVVPNDIVNYVYASENTKFLSTFKLFFYYLRLLVVPHPLVYDYSYNVLPSGKLSDWMTILGLFSFLIILFFAFKSLKTRSTFGFGLSLLLVTSAPALGFVFLRGGILAERFMYAPVLAFAILLMIGFEKILKIDFADKSIDLIEWTNKNLVLIGVIAVLTGLYSFKTIIRNPDWKDEITLYRSGYKYHQNSAQILRHLGYDKVLNAYNAYKDPQKAKKFGEEGLAYYRKALAIHPNFGDVLHQVGYIHHFYTSKPDSAKYYYKLAKL